jgi:transposase
VNRDGYEASELVFIDECGINIGMARAYGYKPIGERLFDSKPGVYSKNYTVLGALSLQGMQAMMVVEGGTTTEVFYEYARQILIPSIEVGSVVVLDNLSAHHSVKVRELFDEHGIHLLYTPPYSPEWNPIEWAWSKVKTFLRQYAARSLDALEDALVQAADLITPQDALHWIVACGYDGPDNLS